MILTYASSSAAAEVKPCSLPARQRQADCCSRKPGQEVKGGSLFLFFSSLLDATSPLVSAFRRTLNLPSGGDPLVLLAPLFSDTLILVDEQRVTLLCSLGCHLVTIILFFYHIKSLLMNHPSCQHPVEITSCSTPKTHQFPLQIKRLQMLSRMNMRIIAISYFGN